MVERPRRLPRPGLEDEKLAEQIYWQTASIGRAARTSRQQKWRPVGLEARLGDAPIQRIDFTSKLVGLCVNKFA